MFRLIFIPLFAVAELFGSPRAFSQEAAEDCSHPLACNFHPNAQSDSGCEFCSCDIDTTAYYSLEFIAFGSDITEGTKIFRIYLNAVGETNAISAVFGSDEEPLQLNTSTGFYNNEFGGVTAWSINPFLLGVMPELSADIWVTIGIEENSVGETISTVQSPTQLWTGCFPAGLAFEGQNVVNDDVLGGGWFVLGDSPNGIAGDDMRQQPNRTRKSFHGLRRSGALY